MNSEKIAELLQHSVYDTCGQHSLRYRDREKAVMICFDGVRFAITSFPKAAIENASLLSRR
jgi:hypothetical protein